MSARIAFLLAGAWLIGCTTVDDIQKQRPIMQLAYPGSPAAVAECVQPRLGARVYIDPQNRYVLYGSVKGQSAEGLTHYSITLGPRRGTPGGYAEWRVVAPPSSGRFGPNTVTENAVRMYWRPVEECARTKGVAS